MESKKNPKFERFGEVRYTTKGLIIDPISVYKPTGSSSHYGEAAAYAHPYEFDTLMYQPGTEGWDDFIELARKRVLNYMRGKKNGHK